MGGSWAYDAPWQSAQQRDAAREALGRFLAWHTAGRDRRQVASEVGFTITLDLPGGAVLLRGFMDRVELDRDGRVHVVDLKTGKSPVSKAELAAHPQLGTYQLAVRAGALDDVLPDRPEVGGAELVMLRLPEGEGPKVQAQEALSPGVTWVEELLDTAVRRVLGGAVPADPARPVRTLRFPQLLPRAVRRPAGGLVTPADLRTLLGIDFTADQLAAATAPLAPGVDRCRSGVGQDQRDGRPGRLAGRHRTGRSRARARPDLHEQGRRRAGRSAARGVGQGRHRIRCEHDSDSRSDIRRWRAGLRR